MKDYSFSVYEKRLASGWFVYSLIEIKQRFRIPGPISSDIDLSLADYHVQIRDGFYTFWGAHKCDVSFVLLSNFYFICNLLSVPSMPLDLIHTKSVTLLCNKLNELFNVLHLFTKGRWVVGNG